jgi:hypothetical protein
MRREPEAARRAMTTMCDRQDGAERVGAQKSPGRGRGFKLARR